MSAQDQSLYIDIREEDVQRFIDQVDLAAAANAQEIHRYVEIPAHIKEIHEDHILIRSDADRYPGAFTVSDAQGAAGTDTLKEGAGIRILMEDLHERDAQGLPCYRAEDILVLADADRPDTARADILLTAAPALTLSDTLSSTLNGFQVLSGSYTWTVLDGGQAQSVVACGSAPLAAETKDDIPRLRLPRYNGADQVLYSFNTQISPDLLTIRQWDSTVAGDPDAKEQMVTTCYQPLPFIQLEAGKIYEVSAEWDNSTADQKGPLRPCRGRRRRLHLPRHNSQHALHVHRISLIGLIHPDALQPIIPGQTADLLLHVVCPLQHGLHPLPGPFCILPAPFPDSGDPFLIQITAMDAQEDIRPCLLHLLDGAQGLLHPHEKAGGEPVSIHIDSGGLTAQHHGLGTAIPADHKG